MNIKFEIIVPAINNSAHAKYIEVMAICLEKYIPNGIIEILVKLSVILTYNIIS
jgi:hypothetical protein